MAVVVQRAEFRAMGCAAVVEIVGGDATLIERARTQIDHLEACWSRFRPTSDVCRLNAAGGAPVAVDPSTIALLEAMVHGFIATDGAFDPTLLAPLVGLGYAASWHDPSAVTSVPAGSTLSGRIDEVAIDTAESSAQLPVGTIVDAGGIGKGLAADRVVAALLAAGATGALVELGGDLAVAGEGPAEGDWLIGVADPDDPEREVLQVGLRAGGVATSGTLRRSWPGPDGAPVHHLLDPATGRPVVAAAGHVPVVQATVVAGSGMWAEVFTKPVMVRGLPALGWLDELGLGARAVLADGTAHCNEGWALYERTPCTRS
jgi:thiamine biosynthesis lipoprotein